MMEGLLDQNMALIAKFVRGESDAADLIKLRYLLQKHPELNSEIIKLNVHLENDPLQQDGIDVESALQKLRLRLQNEKLI
jgi:hypothetical protein